MILHDEQAKLFTLHTRNTTYQMKVGSTACCCIPIMAPGCGAGIWPT